MNIWFSSDFHFSHVNITGPKVSRWKSGYRDFESTYEMNKSLTETINKYVKEDDILYFLGDFCFGGHQKTPLYRNYLNCKTIHFIKGNHDNHIGLYKDSFTSLNERFITKLNGVEFFFSHYPQHNHPYWPGRNRGVIHLYGHTHNTIPNFEKSMDVGVDAAYSMFKEYRPFNIDEIIEIMNGK
jgi:calcineurin-like phosphoesterase family protein